MSFQKTNRNSKIASSTLSGPDLSKILAVRERMDRQCAQDLLSLKASNKLVTTCRGLRRRVEHLERLSRDHQGKLADLCSDTRDINKILGILSSRDFRRLPQKAIDDAKQTKNPWNL
ncbi:unnamed protein product [Oikopleura dioica]|uniref:Uncharacterized protein n=1 Tax=Oikopleura dioica TaxID=34765 RepID=E4Y9D8_OIKDI|nr:unnamed protein product [Oikopleura dioica]